ncbi:hypothetical protein AB6F64_22065 [Providencia hangzhouensis]|uniref:Uncharacterized protein n=2 Tax=Providencia TaxID=586 RepID=A0A9N8D7L9_PRORE|nr:MULTISPECIES: hypothetical protein [Providencia]MCJ4607330.1 hypothetical protein [Klebsiella pneumoniae]EIU9513639.1 hypothetical protein [Providencia rettgeri]ELR5099775.1 hypothetical protein [Providencia rettgeri]ELR5267209.1 hypothetical protein [Providencia rettgeri]EMC8781200.1 hypothetical protein [Providencia rettgeri]
MREIKGSSGKPELPFISLETGITSECLSVKALGFVKKKWDFPESTMTYRWFLEFKTMR